MNTMDERWYIPDEWRPVRGYEGIYEVSNSGRVRRIADGKGAVAGRVLSLRFDSKGYPAVILYNNTGVKKSFKVHRLVVIAFLGGIPEGKQVNHLNGIKGDNRLLNLELVTASENTRHSFDVLGKQVPKGSAHGNAKLDENSVREIKIRRANGEKLKALSGEYGVNQAQISAICTGRLWKHVQV